MCYAFLCRRFAPSAQQRAPPKSTSVVFNYLFSSVVPFLPRSSSSQIALSSCCSRIRARRRVRSLFVMCRVAILRVFTHLTAAVPVIGYLGHLDGRFRATANILWWRVRYRRGVARHHVLGARRASIGLGHRKALAITSLPHAAFSPTGFLVAFLALLIASLNRLAVSFAQARHKSLSALTWSLRMYVFTNPVSLRKDALPAAPSENYRNTPEPSQLHANTSARASPTKILATRQSR